MSEVTADNISSNISQDKLLKKPDKILPCPRCSSMETKFCFYNNYSVNQPRHFCRNCQRYWTAGGTMRNLPVGAGRRKNKCSSYSSNSNQHITVSDELHRSLERNTTVLSFGSDSPLCNSMSSVFISVEKSMNKYNPNIFHHKVEQPSGSVVDPKCLANDGNSNCSERFAVQVPFPWSLPISFYPNMANWGMPWLSPTLGKHSRDGNLLKQGNSEKGDSHKQDSCLLMPKIDDPEAAARNSIWSLMSFKDDKGDDVTNKRELFMDFQYKGELKDHSAMASLQILYNNPAAHLRSLNFHEGTQISSAHE